MWTSARACEVGEREGERANERSEKWETFQDERVGKRENELYVMARVAHARDGVTVRCVSLTCYRVGELVPEEVLAHEPLSDGVSGLGTTTNL